jgi:hypothetical protein
LTRASVAASAALGVGLIAYPFALAPANHVTALATGAALILGATLATRWGALVGIAGAAIGLEYGVALLTGDTLLDAFAGPFAAGWLLHMELLSLACAERGDVTDAVGARRRLVRAIVLGAAGCAVALLAQLGASLGFAASRWVVVIAAASAAGALGLIPALAMRALGSVEDAEPG